MKKMISMILILTVVFSLCACGGNSDKDKLIGTYFNHFESHFTTPNGSSDYLDEVRHISFSADNTFYYEAKGNSKIYMYGVKIIDRDTDFSGSGTYRLEDGFIILEIDENSELADNVPSFFLEPIPYYINEYTKELVFNVGTDGTSDWSKTSNVPSAQDTTPEQNKISDENTIVGEWKAVEVIVNEEVNTDPYFLKEFTASFKSDYSGKLRVSDKIFNLEWECLRKNSDSIEYRLNLGSEYVDAKFVTDSSHQYSNCLVCTIEGTIEGATIVYKKT